jgi:hypothetical protein
MDCDLAIRGCTSGQMIGAGAIPVDDLVADLPAWEATTPIEHAPKRRTAWHTEVLRSSATYVESCA